MADKLERFINNECQLLFMEANNDQHNKEERVTCRLSQEEAELLKNSCQKEGLTLSSYVRRCAIVQSRKKYEV